MEGTTPPREDEPRRRREPETLDRTSSASSFSLFAILIAILAVLIAVLINLMGIGRPQKPEPKPDNGPIGVRINYKDLLRLTEPYHALYEQDLPPFHAMQTRRFDTPGPNATCPQPTRPSFSNLDIMASRASFHGIDSTQRACGIYPTIGKITTTRHQSCTGTMVWNDVVLTADHCLPWGKNESVWESIKFTPAYDGASPHPELYGSARPVRCVGVNPSLQDGRDMAVCKLNIPIGDACGKAKLGKPPNDWNAEWYKQQDWWSIGYPRGSNGGNTPVLHGDFGIDEVKLIDEGEGCHVLNTAFFADQGWSGGPAFSYDPQTGKAVVGAVVMNCDNAPDAPPGCAESFGTNLAAGLRMQALVEFGILRWMPGMGFGDWNFNDFEV
ncbi:trypsin-like cysteine/serine peptidase domain-containing protein [Podospora aff. communis PSN243]|uniref:Trypsin-like cysteine/serine peptidase domain-containing protein n=1 Tax=Podospora aff. communis PSN243 TaxID=3040156 RepID=A0AAV9GJ73_9PEZI|nr:trypsin-like cysteine/serine peptidase domain-containing protein [Podospora aff. communis PSN243]